MAVLTALATAGFAMPVAAQSNICGGVGDAGQWIGGTEAGSDVSTATSHMEQMAIVLMGNEYVALFNVSQPTGVRVEAAGRGGGDPVIDLRDSAGTIILSDDDSGGEGSSRGELQLNPGTYCLSMNSYDGAPMTGFVRVGRLEQEALTQGLGMGIPDVGPGPSGGSGCSSVSNYIGDGGPIDRNLMSGGASVTASVDQIDAWGFSLASAASISVTAENEMADPVITIFDSMGNFVAENDDFDGLNSRIDLTTPLAAGDYCIEMRALSDTSAPVTVSITGYDPAAALVGLYERGEASPPLDGSYPVTPLGPLANRVRQDLQVGDVNTWLSFEIDSAGLVLIEGVSNGIGDPIMVLYDDFGRLVSENDDYGGNLDPLISARVNPGTYLVGIRQLSEGQNGLVRLLFERYVPAP